VEFCHSFLKSLTLPPFRNCLDNSYCSNTGCGIRNGSVFDGAVILHLYKFNNTKKRFLFPWES
jgi:hypothetical protein